MIRFLEAEWLRHQLHRRRPMSTDARSLLLNHKVFVSSGHDEYWSGRQRANVEAARDAGVNLAFFSGNEVFWKTRWEPSHRRLGHAGPHADDLQGDALQQRRRSAGPARLDGNVGRSAVQPTGGRRPSAERPDGPGVRGQLGYVRHPGAVAVRHCGSGATPPSRVSRRVRRHTRRGTGRSATSGTSDADNGFRPPGSRPVLDDRRRRRGRSPTTARSIRPATATHHLTLYRAPSGALVFGAGTVQWSWGLDNTNAWHASGSGSRRPRTCSRRRSTCSPTWACSRHADVRSRLRVRASTDTTAPTVDASRRPRPDAGSRRRTVDDHRHGERRRRRWSPASRCRPTAARLAPGDRHDDWTYTWTVHGNPTATISPRAVDDSGNLGPGSGEPVNVSCPCSLWSAPRRRRRPTPGTQLGRARREVHVGHLRHVSGIRFYKAAPTPARTSGSLWSATGSARRRRRSPARRRPDGSR